jgi:pseudomonalisin
MESGVPIDHTFATAQTPAGRRSNSENLNLELKKLRSHARATRRSFASKNARNRHASRRTFILESGSIMNATMLRSSPLTALAIAITLVLATSGTTALAASGMAAVASATSLRPDDAVTGTLSNAQPMHIVVALKLRNQDQLESLIAARKILTSDQFTSLHAPTQSQAQAVADYLGRMGFKNVVIASNNMLVSADGTAYGASAAFLTSFKRVRTREGRIAYANDTDAHIPAALQDSVLSVIGLQNVYTPHTFALRAQPKAGAGTFSDGPHKPVDFSPIYGGTGVKTAAGVKVGIITQGPLSQTISDLNTFTATNGLTTVKTEIVGGVGPDQGGTTEWNLDSQDIVGMAGGQVGEIIFYEMATFYNPDLVTDFNAIVKANVVKIINVSLGECETGAEDDGSAAAADAIFKVAVAQGQTFSVATGDAGAENLCGGSIPLPSWPADSPWVVAVGGTTLDASTTTWNSETVWTGAGGAPSAFEPKPSWQNGFAPGTTRGVPDIAFDADPNSGSLIFVGGAIQKWGGTSLAAPIFSGSWSRVIATNGTGVGFAAPLLYQLPETAFHDITVGNNGGEQAKVGYDFASGRGSIILASMVHGVGAPSKLVANFTQTSAGLLASFIDKSTDPGATITSRAWSFGDGGSSMQTNPSHFFSAPGTYNVTESVTDSAGYLLAKTIPVTIGTRK